MHVCSGMDWIRLQCPNQRVSHTQFSFFSYTEKVKFDLGIEPNFYFFLDVPQARVWTVQHAITSSICTRVPVCLVLRELIVHRLSCHVWAIRASTIRHATIYSTANTVVCARLATMAARVNFCSTHVPARHAWTMPYAPVLNPSRVILALAYRVIRASG